MGARILLKLLHCLLREKPSREVGMKLKPHSGEDGDSQDLPGMGPLMGFPQCFGGFSPVFEEKTLNSVMPSQSLCSDISKEENQGKEPPNPDFFWRQEV